MMENVLRSPELEGFLRTLTFLCATFMYFIKVIQYYITKRSQDMFKSVSFLTVFVQNLGMSLKISALSNLPTQQIKKTAIMVCIQLSPDYYYGTIDAV